MITDLSHPVTPTTRRDSFRAWASQRPIAAPLLLLFSIGYLVMALPVLADHGVIPSGWMPQIVGLDAEPTVGDVEKRVPRKVMKDRSVGVDPVGVKEQRGRDLFLTQNQINAAS